MRSQYPHSQAGYQLQHHGAIALAQVENNGVRVDVAYMKEAIERVSARIEHNQKALREFDLYHDWRYMFGQKTSMGSRTQMAKVLDKRGLLPKGATNLDADVLAQIDHPFIEKYLEVEKLKKLNSTYLQSTLDETSPDGFCRAFYNLHLATTFRSSGSNPNIQNQPIRDKLQGKMIRRGFLPTSDDYRIVEIDYSSIEVRVAAAYHQDPKMMTYLSDPSSDMHRDAACKMFICEPDQVHKTSRFVGKNGFVFPAFYGDYYASMAGGIWKQLVADKPVLSCGKLVIDHLAEKGITELGACDPEKEPVRGTYEHHLKEVEDWFWLDNFTQYDTWKKHWYKQYQNRGWFQGFSGFTFSGVMRRNIVINSPVQSAAFHCLLWSLIKVQKIMNKRKWKSKIIGQIHDSLIADVHKDEYEDYLALAKEVMTTRMKQHWAHVARTNDIQWTMPPERGYKSKTFDYELLDWKGQDNHNDPLGEIPIDVEAEATPLGGSWYEKEVVEI